MKKITVLMCVAAFAGTGCMKPYDVPEFHEIGTSHTAFLVPLEGDTGQQAKFDSEEFLNKRMVATKRIQIHHMWVQTGRMPNSGKWVPSERLITADRAPVTREWSPSPDRGTSNRDEGIWVESKDSVGFSTGISCTARIPTEQDASKFLFNYPAAANLHTMESDGQSNGTGGLSQIMDSEIRAQIQSRMAEFAALYTMDDLREKKNEQLAYVRFGTVPEGIDASGLEKTKGVIEFFAERGIMITTLGQFGGFTYENPKIQDAIDNVFAAQQDEEVAKAESKAQRERNEAVKLAAEGKAEAARLQAQGEADAIQTVADAKAYEIEKAQQNWEQYLALKQLELEKERLEKWDGAYPVNFMGSDLPGGNFLIGTAPVSKPAAK